MILYIYSSRETMIFPEEFNFDSIETMEEIVDNDSSNKTCSAMSTDNIFDDW